MKTLFIFAVTISFIISNPGIASSDEKLAEVMGISALLEDAKAHERKVTEQRIDLMIQRMSGLIEKFPKNDQENIIKAFRKFTDAARNTWKVDEARDLYLDVWKQHYPSDLSTLTEKLDNPETRKILEVALEAQQKLNNYLQQQSQSTYEEALNELLAVIDAVGK